MPEMAYVNGTICPVEEAKVSVRDRGFVFGDGVYDVARLRGGRPLRLGRHLERLRRSASAVEMTAVPELDELRAIVDELVDRAGLDEGMIYAQLTRGVARRASAFPEDVDPTIFVSVEHTYRGAKALVEDGASATIVPDIRWGRNDIKSTNLLPKVLMGQRAARNGVYEALYRDDDGHVWEGTSTNLFVVHDGALVTAPECRRILAGLTRADVLEVAGDLGVDCELRPLMLDDLRDADEAFLTGTLTEVLGVVRVDDFQIGAGPVGPLTRKLRDAYLERFDATPK